MGVSGIYISSCHSCYMCLHPTQRSIKPQKQQRADLSMKCIVIDPQFQATELYLITNYVHTSTHSYSSQLSLAANNQAAILQHQRSPQSSHHHQRQVEIATRPLSNMANIGPTRPSSESFLRNVTKQVTIAGVCSFAQKNADYKASFDNKDLVSSRSMLIHAT